jgi:hypothetical protein
MSLTPSKTVWLSPAVERQQHGKASTKKGLIAIKDL